MNAGSGSLPAGQATCRSCRRARRNRTCEACGSSFTAAETSQRYCSRECLPKRPQTFCEICGSEYKPTYPAQRTCGRICGAELRRQVYGWAGNRPKAERWPSRRVWYVSCDWCGKLFTATRPKAKRCGDECRRLAQIRDIKTNIMSRYRGDPAFRERMITASQDRRASRLGVASDAATISKKELITYLIKRDRGRCGICHRPVRAKTGPRRPSIDHITPLSRGGKHVLENLQVAHYVCNLSKGNRGGGEQLLMIG